MARDEFERNKDVKDIVSFTYRIFTNGRVGVVRGGVLPSLPAAAKTHH